MISKNSKIFLAGHNGMIGSAIYRNLKKKNYKNIITIDRAKLDLRDQKKVFSFFKRNKIKSVINAAGTVGEFMQIINIKQNLFMIIYLSKIILFTHAIKVESKI